MNITDRLLIDATGCTAANAGLYAAHLEEACQRYSITTPARLAAFLAQVGHESRSLRYAREIWGPTPAQARYEGRTDLGNTEPGDGLRYCGRGLIQTTGRWNYRRVTLRLRSRLGATVPDFEAEPAELERPRWAALSAADYWDMHKLNDLADAGDFAAITRKINGGMNGQTDRLARWAKAKRALSVDAVYTSPGPVQETPKTEHVAKEAPVALPAILAALLPSLIQVVPKLGKMFGSGSEVSERNVAAVTMAMDVAKEALGAKSAQEAIETALADPEAAQQVRQAIESRWLELSEAGGDGIAGARAAALAYSQPDGPRFWFNPAFWVSMIMLTMPIMLLIDVFYVHPESYVGEIRTQIVTGILLVIGMVGGYWIGTSFSSARKTEIAANGRQP